MPSYSPQVSVIVAAYNHARFLPQALESVLSQDLGAEQFEVLVIDDGSTDATPEVLRGYTSRLMVLTQPHQGLAAACNAGFATARGEYLARVDADDLVEPSWLRQMLEVLECHPEACCVYPDYVQLLTDGTAQPMPADEGNLFSLLACGVVFRAEAVRAVGGLRPLYWEEYDLYLRLQAHGTFVHLSEPLYLYRRHSLNMTADERARMAGWQQLLAVWGKERLLASGDTPDLLTAIAQAEGCVVP